MTEINHGGVELCPAPPCFAASPMRDGYGVQTANILTVSAPSVVSEPLGEKNQSFTHGKIFRSKE